MIIIIYYVLHVQVHTINWSFLLSCLFRLSAIIAEILQEDEESESELSDHGSETFDHIISDGPQSTEE